MIVEKIRQVYCGAVYFGTFNALYGPAKRAIKFSMQSVQEFQ